MFGEFSAGENSTGTVGPSCLLPTNGRQGIRASDATRSDGYHCFYVFTQYMSAELSFSRNWQPEIWQRKSYRKADGIKSFFNVFILVTFLRFFYVFSF